MFRSRKGLSALAALAATAGLGACSSSGGGSSNTIGKGGSAPPASNGNATGAAAPGAPLKVGMICSCSGPFGTTIAAAGKTAQAWEKAVNAAGGINGRQVDMTVADDGGNPGTSVTKVQSMISSHVDVILDLTPLDAAWEKAATTAKIPVVGGNFSAEPYYQNSNFYPSGQTNDSIVYANVLTAKLAGAKNMGQLYCAEAPQCQESVAPHKAAGKTLGVPFIYNASIAATAPNYTAQCVAAKQAGVQALFIGDSASVIVRVMQDCHQQGYDPIYVTEGTGFTMQLANTPAANDHLWSPFPSMPFFADKPQVQKMNAALDKYYPGTRTSAVAFSHYAAQAWTGGLLIEKAVAASGVAVSATMTPADVTKGLNSLKNETLDGWSPPLTFHAGKPTPVDCWYTARVQNGEPVLANGGKLTCQNGAA